MDTIAVMEGSDPFSRIPEEMTKALRNTRVTIAGVGSGGGEVALNLASAGVGHIVLFDDDRLHPENYVRHALTKRDLGRTKIAGLRDAFRERNLPTKVVTHARNIVTWLTIFVRVSRGTDRTLSFARQIPGIAGGSPICAQ